MFGRLSLVRGAMLAACPVGLLVAAAILSMGVTPFAPLSSPELGLSRGSNQDKYSGTFSCNTLGSVGGCDSTHAPGSTCITCHEDNYTDTGNTTGGGMNAGGAGGGSCGNIWNGICDMAHVCVKSLGGDSNTACTKPPSPPVAQAN